MSLELFQLGERLGSGGQGHTVRAVERSSQATVVVKELDLQRVEDAKAIELFEREARVLEQLDHPNIPKYVSSFTEQDDRGGLRYYLVQQFVDGPTLEEVIESGRRFSQDDAEDLTRQLLDILVYLQSRDPVILHRDIKPANILMRPDGSVALVDFGAARVVARETYADSTVIGTSGYMAPEQFTGRAVPASDLYGVGATLVHVLSHRHPADLPMHKLAIDFRPYVNVTPDFERFLDRLVAPVLEDRFPTATEALALLDDLQGIEDYVPPPDHTMMTRVGPRGTSVQLRRTKGKLDLVVPGAGRPVMLGTWAVVWLLSIGAMVPYLVMQPMSIIHMWSAVALLGVALVLGTKRELQRFEQVTLHVDQHGVHAERDALLRAPQVSELGDLLGVDSIAVEALGGSRRRPHEVRLETQRGEFEFGQYLSPAERNWIIDELRDAAATLSAPDEVEFARDTRTAKTREATHAEKQVETTPH